MFNMVGKWLGSRQIRCNWAAKGAGADDKQNSDVKSVVELTSGTSGELQCLEISDTTEVKLITKFMEVYFLFLLFLLYWCGLHSCLF